MFGAASGVLAAPGTSSPFHRSVSPGRNWADIPTKFLNFEKPRNALLQQKFCHGKYTRLF